MNIPAPLDKVLSLLKKDKIRTALYAVALVLILFSLLDKNQPYYFYYLEQRQMLLLDGDYISNMISQIGGLGIFLSQLLVQYFLDGGVGPAVTAVLLSFSALFLYKGLRDFSLRPAAFFLALLPVLMQLVYMEDFYYYYHGVVAIFLASLLFFVLSLLPGNLNAWLRCLIEAVVLVAAYLLLGPVALPLSLAVALRDILKGQKQSYLSLVGVALVALLGLYVVNKAILPTMGQGLGMTFYIDHIQNYATHYSLSWIFLAVLPLLTFLLGKIRGSFPALSLLTGFVALLAVFLFVRFEYRAHQDSTTNDFQRLVHQMRRGQWQDIISDPIASSNALYQNIHNLALSKEGRLLTDLFRYPQSAASKSLIVDNEYVVELHEILSQIYYQAGLTGAAQLYAQEVFSSLRWGCPSVVQTTIKTQLAYGNYPIAEKYIRLMERTLKYADWAKDMRRYLDNDALVMEDEELGRLRRDLSEVDTEFLLQTSAYADLFKVLEANPSDQGTRDYTVAMLLLERDTPDMMTFVERFKDTEAMKNPPLLLQQAIITLNEQDLEYCKSLGVTDAVINQFNTFKQRVVQLRRQGAGYTSLAREFSGTYWYYLLSAAN